ncbi:YARHG domain-containing protein [Phormidesmis sp. 146-33]
MGRYIFNETLAKMVPYFGLPTLPIMSNEPIVLDFAIDTVRQVIPDFPQDGNLQVTFVRSVVRQVTFRPDFPAKKLFAFLFGYQPATEIKVSVNNANTGLYSDIRCLGDGIHVETQMTGGRDNYVRFSYTEDFVAPYDLLEAQQYKLGSLDYVTETKDNEYPWLSERQVTEADIQGVDVTQLYIMFHSIYARKGLIYYNDFLKRVFEKQPWYRPLYQVQQFKQNGLPKLSEIEQSNLDFLRDRFWNKL